MYVCMYVYIHIYCLWKCVHTYVPLAYVHTFFLCFLYIGLEFSDNHLEEKNVMCTLTPELENMDSDYRFV